MFVGRICTRQVDLVEPNESVQVAASRMNARNVGTLVVVNQQKKPVGLITDRDLTTKVLALGKSAAETIVQDVMTHHPETVRENESLDDALRKMRAGPFRRLPVVDANGKLLGLLSLDDMVELLAQEFKEIGRVIERESPTALARS